MADDDIDDDDDHNHDHAAPAADPVLIALTLCRIANNKTLERAIKKLVKLDEQYAVAEEKFVDLQSQAAAMQTALTARAAELDAREAAITKREDEFASSLEDARANLRGYYDSIADADRITRYRILSSADLLSNFNPQLQDLPSWDTIRRLVDGLPPDLPAAPPAEIISENVRQDWVGHTFVPGSTLTRSIIHKPSQ
jgi:hypothetical protein